MATYKIDSAHSEVSFKIKHLMITNVTGNFTKFDGTLESNQEDFTDAQISFEADIDSITTHNEQRDGHLKSPEFFDAARFPKINFQSTSFEKEGDTDYKLAGDFTMHGVTKPITLDADFGGTTKDPWGQSKIGFEVTGKINRKDFGLEWNAALETGGVMLGEDVKLMINIELIKQA